MKEKKAIWITEDRVLKLFLNFKRKTKTGMETDQETLVRIMKKAKIIQEESRDGFTYEVTVKEYLNGVPSSTKMYSMCLDDFEIIKPWLGEPNAEPTEDRPDRPDE